MTQPGSQAARIINPEWVVMGNRRQQRLGLGERWPGFLLRQQLWNATIPYKFEKFQVIVKLIATFQYVINGPPKLRFIINFLAWTSIPGVDARNQCSQTTPNVKSQCQIPTI